ncbi:MAG: rhodanese-like domain-containing protein [Bdellovibrionota bacterium]|nr:rhodanese-like domain-containing protein [Bdellovibrionota bacterium]
MFNQNFIVAFAVVLGLVAFKLYANGKYSKNIEAVIGQNPQLLDVRTVAEYEEAHSDKMINIPLDRLEQNLIKLDKTRPIIVFCRSGNRSGQAVKLLEASGYKNVVNGGAWTNIKD